MYLLFKRWRDAESDAPRISMEPVDDIIVTSLAVVFNQGCIVGEIEHKCRTSYQLLPRGKHETNNKSAAQGYQGWSRI